MPLIDTEVLINWIDGSQRLDTEHDYDEVARYIEECPTVDAVPVVRCKDCQFGLVGKQNVICMKHSPLVPRTHDFNYFCADGKRKGGDE